MKALHNDTSIDISDATMKQIEKSIAWYKKNIPRVETEKYSNPTLLERCKKNLEYCEAELKNRTE